MSGRAAQAASQSDPEKNVQFRRWRTTETTGLEIVGIRAWHSRDLDLSTMSPTRRIAERAWVQVTRGIAQ